MSIKVEGWEYRSLTLHIFIHMWINYSKAKGFATWIRVVKLSLTSFFLVHFVNWQFIFHRLNFQKPLCKSCLSHLLIPLCPQQSPVLQDGVNNVSWKCNNHVDYWVLLLSRAFVTMEMCLSLPCNIYYQEYSKVVDGE